MAQFIGKVPNFSYVQKMVQLIWGAEGDVDIFPVGDNLFIFQFPSTAVRDRILESGPWHMNNQPLIIRKWEPGLKSLDFSLSKVPIWLHLRNVPLELFTRRGLSYIASAIGNPLYMDSITAERKKLAYAKVCVEIEVASKIPKYITIVLGKDCKTSVVVETLWLPAKCAQCCVFGHSDRTCLNKKIGENVQMRKPKQVKAIDVGFGNNSILEVGSGSGGSRNSQGKEGSDVKFYTMLEEAAKDVKKPYSVAALMDNIKTQVRDSLAKRKLEVEKGKGILVADVNDDKVQEMPHVQGRINGKDEGCSTDGNEDVNYGDEEMGVSFDSTMHSTGRPKLPIAVLNRPQRLVAQWVVKAIEVVKAQNKKSRRQAKKFSASKKC
ncbi:hypothetical protein PTKIN_Ptkin11bG0052800 [Pterospermum kingtungense]